MITKKYKAKSQISLNVVLANSHCTRVSFQPLTSGGSVFKTDNANIQHALERHPKFGKLFRLAGVENVVVVQQQTGEQQTGRLQSVKEAVVTEDQAEQTSMEQTEQTSMEQTEQVVMEQAASDANAPVDDAEHSFAPSDEGVNGSQTVRVTCNDDAKDYLADKFGVSRSKMRTRVQIDGVAKEHGIEFVWE